MPTFDDYEEDFVALTAKAGCRLALVGVAPPAPTASHEDGASVPSSSSPHVDDAAASEADSLEHLQVATMLLGQASDVLDAMEVELRLCVRDEEDRRMYALWTISDARSRDLRRRYDGCYEQCSALRAECRQARQRLRRMLDSELERREKEAEERLESKPLDEGDTIEFGEADATRGSGDNISIKSQDDGCSGGESAARSQYRSSLFDKSEFTNRTLTGQNATLERARRIMADTEETAGSISLELARNRETIESATDRVGEIHGMTNNARRTIKTMQRRKKWLL